MLSQIAARPNIWGTASESNRGWPVPGSTGWTTPNDWPRNGTDRNWNAQMPASAAGLSYYEMYEAMRAAQAAAGVTQWPADINGTGGLKLNSQDPLENRADSAFNRKFLIWYLQTTYAAQDAAFEAAAYSVIRSHFGQNTVCSNYEYADYDGVEDWTGWYLDLANASQPSNRFPRVWLDRSASFALMAKDNVLGPTLHDRWVGTRQKNGASMNSPVLYPLQYLQLAGHPGLPQQKSHSQANLYLPTSLSCYTCNSDCTYIYNPDPAGDQCEGTCITHKYRIEETDA